MTISRKIYTTLALLLLLVVLPLGSWYYLQIGLNYYKKTMAELKDYGKLPDFALTSQFNNTLTKQDLRGKVVVANFIFTRCTTICPRMTSQMHRVYEQFKHRKDVVFLSHTVDPSHDSVSVLKLYAKNFDIPETKQWYLLTGEQAAIYDLARKGYQLPASEGQNGGGDDFLHSPYFALLDTSLTIRNYYDGTDSMRVNRMIEHIALLMPREQKPEVKYNPEKER